MNREEIMAAIRSLAQSQGFYCRLLQAFERAKDTGYFDSYMEMLEAQHFKDEVEMVLFFEQ